MSILLVQSCSKSKAEVDTPVPALELYSGFFFNIINKAIREGEMDTRIDICILSAKHGLIDADEKISWYDRRMDQERAAELAPSVQANLEGRVNGIYDHVIVNVGGTYREALAGIESRLDTEVHYIEGAGIGYKGQALKRVLRGDLEPLSENGTLPMEAN
jgi:hypothetical protein